MIKREFLKPSYLWWKPQTLMLQGINYSSSIRAFSVTHYICSKDK
jgi:hypothetical protein